MSYTRGTFTALVDALIPETPDLASRGEVHVPGGIEAGLVDAVIGRVNNFLETRGIASQVTEAVPLAPAVALLLNIAAIELIVRGHAKDGLTTPAPEFSRGVFSRLSRQDRLRALRLLEDDGVFPWLADRFNVAAIGTIQFLASSMPILIEFVYYSDACAESSTQYTDTTTSSEETAPGMDDSRSLGWQQAGYPGPADGYPVMLGYELESFEENEYEDA